IAKPIDPAPLAAILRKWLPRASSRGDAAVAVFDEAALVGRLMDDRMLAATIIGGFLEDMPKQLALLREHIEKWDRAAAGRIAHSIKGAALSVSASSFRNAALEMERDIIAGDLSAMTSRLCELERQFQAASEAMQNIGTGL